jgi:glycosyltransferase involved in cell wall biosynthesis
VPIRSPQAIAEAISWYADHRAETVEMGRAAQVKAAEYTWEAYGDRIVAAIRELCV